MSDVEAVLAMLEKYAATLRACPMCIGNGSPISRTAITKLVAALRVALAGLGAMERGEHLETMDREARQARWDITAALKGCECEGDEECPACVPTSASSRERTDHRRGG